MMDPEIKEKWLTDLRSGLYEQGQYCLRRVIPKSQKSEYCCLGVLANVIVNTYPETYQWKYYTTGSVAVMNDKTQQSQGRFGLTTEILALVNLNENQQATCVKMNDQERKSFAEIADYIEANF